MLTLLSFPSVSDDIAAWGPWLAWIDGHSGWLLPAAGYLGLAILFGVSIFTRRGAMGKRRRRRMSTDERRAAERAENPGGVSSERLEGPPPGTSGAYFVRGTNVTMRGNRSTGDFDQHYNVDADGLEFEDNIANSEKVSPPPSRHEDEKESEGPE